MTVLSPRLGVTLPSLNEDPELSLAVARSAEDAGLDGVFVFDHLFRESPSGKRPALEMTTLLGAVAAETSRVTLGPLVARVTVRPVASLVSATDTLERIAGDRLVVALGSGDSESKPEQVAYGLTVGTPADRVATLGNTVGKMMGRGYPVWVGGTAPPVRRLAASEADGWNCWNAPVGQFATWVSEARSERLKSTRTAEDFTISWGGLALVAATEREAASKWERLAGTGQSAGGRTDVIRGGPEQVADALRSYVDAGADWIVLGLLDSADIESHEILATLIAPLLR